MCEYLLTEHTPTFVELVNLFKLVNLKVEEKIILLKIAKPIRLENPVKLLVIVGIIVQQVILQSMQCNAEIFLHFVDMKFWKFHYAPERLRN